MIPIINPKLITNVADYEQYFKNSTLNNLHPDLEKYIIGYVGKDELDLWLSDYKYADSIKWAYIPDNIKDEAKNKLFKIFIKQELLKCKIK